MMARRRNTEAAVSTSNEALVRHFINLYNQGDWELLDAVMDPDYVHHNNGLTLTLAQFKRGAAWLRAGIPDFHLDIADLVRTGDTVATRMVGKGTHQASMFGEQPTGRSIALHVFAFCRIVDGLIVEDWEAMDEHDLRTQVGVVDLGPRRSLRDRRLRARDASGGSPPPWRGPRPAPAGARAAAAGAADRR